MLDEQIDDVRGYQNDHQQDHRRQIKGRCTHPHRWHDGSDGSQYRFDQAVEELVELADRMVVRDPTEHDDIRKHDPYDQAQRDDIGEPADESHAIGRARKDRGGRDALVRSHQARRR